MGGSGGSFVYALTGASALGGFLFGYDTGVVSGAMLLLRSRFHLDHVWQELVVSCTVGAAWLLSLAGGALADRCGRKPVILVASFLFTAGAVVMGAANDKWVLLVGRLVVGAGLGLASCSVPMYIAEAAPAAQRGFLVTVNTAFITGGQLAAGLVCGAFASDAVHGWRYMLGLSGVPSLVQLVCFLGMPESPRWLTGRGRHDDALAVLRTIRGPDDDVDQELQAIRHAANDDGGGDGRDSRKTTRSQSACSVLSTILTTPHVRRALVLGCALQLFQQLAGINTVMYYSAVIIQMSGVKDDRTAIWLAAATAAINFACTFLGLCLVERIGRRPLTLVSLFGVVASLLLLAGGFQLADNFAPPVTVAESVDTCSSYSTCSACTATPTCGYCYVAEGEGAANGSCLPFDRETSDGASAGRCAFNASTSSPVDPSVSWAVGWCPSRYAWLVFAGMGLYLFSFAPGMGPMPWTINSEIYPLWARSTAYSIATSFNWMTNLVVSMSFLSLTEAITKQGAFYLYAGLALTGLVFFAAVLPETKGRSLEEVEGLFARPWLCGGGNPRAKDGPIQRPTDGLAMSNVASSTSTTIEK